MNIILLLTKGFEEIEAVTLIDLLRRANFNLTTFSITDSNEVEGSHNIKIITDELLSQQLIDSADAVVLPGGPGVNDLLKNRLVLEMIKSFNEKNKYICAICAAPQILEKANVIKGRNITCYPSVRANIFSANVHDKKVIVDNNIITGNGVGGAIEMGLKLVEVFSSVEKSEDLAEKILYP